MICSKCGMENNEMAKFCVGCGSPLEAVASSEEPVATPDVQAVQVETVEAPAFDAPPPVAEPKEATANPYYQPYQPPVQPPMQQPTSYVYQPPVMPQNTNEKPVSFGKWMGIMALEYFLSFVHLIMLFVWGFSSGTEESLKNYARARLVWAAIGTVFVVLLFVLIFVIAGFGVADIVSEFSVPTDPYMYY